MHNETACKNIYTYKILQYHAAIPCWYDMLQWIIIIYVDYYCLVDNMAYLKIKVAPWNIELCNGIIFTAVSYL